MPVMLPELPFLPFAPRAIAEHHWTAIETAATDPEAYFGADAPAGYADSAAEQIADYLDRIATYAAAVPDRRDAKQARIALRLIKTAWRIEDV